MKEIVEGFRPIQGEARVHYDVFWPLYTANLDITIAMTVRDIAIAMTVRDSARGQNG